MKFFRKETYDQKNSMIILQLTGVAGCVWISSKADL